MIRWVQWYLLSVKISLPKSIFGKKLNLQRNVTWTHKCVMCRPNTVSTGYLGSSTSLVAIWTGVHHIITIFYDRGHIPISIHRNGSRSGISVTWCYCQGKRIEKEEFMFGSSVCNSIPCRQDNLLIVSNNYITISMSITWQVGVLLPPEVSGRVKLISNCHEVDCPLL